MSVGDATGLANGLRRSADGRVWSALGTHLCGKDGCTKPAWHSGICVSVLGYRRDQKPVQKYTVEPAPSPRELMSQAREKRRLPHSKRPKLGDRVRGKYQGQIGGRNWFNGVVTTVHEDGTCDLHYDDGDHEERVAPRFIKTIAKEETEEVEEPVEVAEPEEPEKVEVMELEEVQVVEEEVEVVEETSERQDAAGASNQQRKLKVLSDSGTGGSGRPRIDEPPALARLIHYGLSSAGSCEMLPDEARAAAAAEGLELVPSSIGETGFKSVTKHVCGKYEVRIQDNGKKRYLGMFATPEEAALSYARFIGAERAAAEAAEARGKGLEPLTADEARVAAAAEGLELAMSTSNETGFKGVYKRDGKYTTEAWENGKLVYLGRFRTPEEAALCYARHIRTKRAAAEARGAEPQLGPQPPTADEARAATAAARAAAAAEGLELVPSTSAESGFKGVSKHGGKYKARKGRHLGMFATPEEAALSYARHIGAKRAAAEAAEARGEGLEPLTADEARAAAAAEGLELVPSSSSETGFRGVYNTGGKYRVGFDDNGKTRHLGIFATPEEAALCYARHVGAERAAAEAAGERGKGPQPLTANEARAAAAAVRAAAAAEGLELVPSSSNQTGFRGVSKNHDKYRAELKSSGKRYHLGMFATPEEAALSYARHIGAERAAAEAVEARGKGLDLLTANEARAAAAAEGLELVPSSSSETGFKGVYKSRAKYEASFNDTRKKRFLGMFATPEEAALCYARYIGAERAAAEAAEAEVAVSKPLTADEARAAAAAEGLELVPSTSSGTGFKGVHKHVGKKYQAQFCENCKVHHLGSFATPEEAALCYARHIGAERAAPAAAEAEVAVSKPLTADEARAAAAAEGLELVPSSSCASGFKGVVKNRGGYKVQSCENRKQRHLGMFATPEEAALCYARFIGAERAAAEAAEARGKGPQPLTANEARAAAAAEGLELVPSSSSETGFKSVYKSGAKYEASFNDTRKKRYLGMFATPEEAALCYARHIGAERAAAEAAEARGEKRQPLTADEARAAAAAEELELVPSSSNETGFKGVRKLGGKYYANMMENSVLRYLGCFATPEEASLARARYIRDLVDGWLIPGRRPPHRPVLKAPAPAPDPAPPSPFPSEVELAEALRCWRLLLTAMRDDQRSQQGSSSSSALPPPSPAATTMHASRKRPAVAVAFAEVGVPRAEALQPQLTAKSGDDPGAARCVICLEALNLSAASASSRGEAACGHTPCCGNYYHKRCLSQWLQGSGQSGSPLPIEKKCPTCRRDLVARALIPRASPFVLQK